VVVDDRRTGLDARQGVLGYLVGFYGYVRIVQLGRRAVDRALNNDWR
jgi:hypothetical protein